MTPPHEGCIGPSVRVQGDVSGRGDLVIEGRFDGRIAIDGEVEVSSRGSVRGRVEARGLTVRGNVVGGPLLAQRITVDAGGVVEADVHSVRISIDADGVLRGSVDMAADPEKRDER